MNKNWEKVSVIMCFIVLVWSVWLHFFSPLDNEWQKFFYIDGHWLVDENEPVLKWLLYRLPKIVCTSLGAFSLALLILNFFKKIKLSEQRKLGLLIFVITVSVYPTLISALKDLIRQPCPRDISLFGGTYSGSLWDYFVHHSPNRCFPGAHASAPFSLMALVYIFNDKFHRALYLFVVLPLAFFIGFYQVAKGAHFVSDTVFTAAFAWIFIFCLKTILLKAKSN